jgi:parvulin-like peptidyl-prolyl isomerase
LSGQKNCYEIDNSFDLGFNRSVPRKLLLFSALIASCTTPPDQVVLAKVGKEKIRAVELAKAFSEKADLYGEDLLKDPEGNLVVKKQLLNGLIEKRLLLQAVREKNISLSSEEEKSLRDRLQSGYGEGELEKVLAEKGIPLDEWLREQKEKFLIEKLIDREVYAAIRPAEEEIGEYYQKHRARFREPDRIRCRHIVTSKEEKAKKIFSLLEKGENFAAVAQKYSESPDREKGGDLGYIARGEYPAIFEQACFSLATGQTSDVIPSEYGFHLFRVVDKKPGRQLSLKEATPGIVARLQEEKGREALRRWLDDLHRNRKIAIDEEALKEVPLGGES